VNIFFRCVLEPELRACFISVRARKVVVMASRWGYYESCRFLFLSYIGLAKHGKSRDSDIREG
jgi:hypothetical protein